MFGSRTGRAADGFCRRICIVLKCGLTCWEPGMKYLNGWFLSTSLAILPERYVCWSQRSSSMPLGVMPHANRAQTPGTRAQVTPAPGAGRRRRSAGRARMTGY